MADAALTQTVDTNKRRFLITASSAVGGIGVVAAATPFVMSFWPSARARAAGAPVEVDIGKIEAGQLITVEWRGKVCWVLNRTKPMLESLPKLDSRLADPNSNVPQQPAYCKNEHRSIKESMWIAIGICTHLGCSPSEKFAIGTTEGMTADWPGGFLCPCHGSIFDLAGRVYLSQPAPTNLEIPPHKWLSDGLVLIGEDDHGMA